MTVPIETIRSIYITTKDMEEASRIAKTLVTEKLAACANLIPKMKSIYFWEGRLNEDDEVIIILKTTEKLVRSLIHRAKEIHSYEVPCILSFKVDEGNPDYLDWVRNSL